MNTEMGGKAKAGPEKHKAARPMKVVKDRGGEPWLCDADVDTRRDLKEQGCWRCAEIPFTRND